MASPSRAFEEIVIKSSSMTAASCIASNYNPVHINKSFEAISKPNKVWAVVICALIESDQECLDLPDPRRGESLRREMPDTGLAQWRQFHFMGAIERKQCTKQRTLALQVFNGYGN